MIYLGADHGGMELKVEVADWLERRGLEFLDLGAHSVDEFDDYPDYAKAVSLRVASDPTSKGILFCRSGAGMAIAANRIRAIRAVVISDLRSTIHAREHNDANIAVIAADWIDREKIYQVIETFLQTQFSHDSRHQRRIDKIDTV